MITNATVFAQGPDGKPCTNSVRTLYQQELRDCQELAEDRYHQIRCMREAIGELAVFWVGQYQREADLYKYASVVLEALRQAERETLAEGKLIASDSRLAEQLREFESLLASTGSALTVLKGFMNTLREKFTHLHIILPEADIQRGERIYQKEFVQEGA